MNLFWIVLLWPLLNAEPALPDERVRDLDQYLALGFPLGSRSLAPALPVAICALEEGGFAILTERPARLRFLQSDGKVRADSWPLPARFSRPRGIQTLSRGHFIIIDRAGHVGEIDREGQLVRMLPGPEGRWQAAALSRAPRGEGWLVTDLLQGKLHHLDPDGHVQQSWSGFIEPTGVCSVGDHIWVSDRGLHRLIQFDPRSQQPDLEQGIGDHGAAPGLLASPMGLCEVGDQFLWVTDRDNHRVQLFSGRGFSMHQFGIHSMLPREAQGRLHYPTAVAYDPRAAVCAVIEPSERRVQLFGVRDPEVAVAAAEQWQRVDLVSHYGRYWALQPGGRLLVVSEPDSERVSVLVRDLEIPFELDNVGGPGDAPTRFRTPMGVDFMPGEEPSRWVVADRGNQRLQMFEVCWQQQPPLRREAALVALVRTVDMAQLVQQYLPWKSPLPPRLTALACGEGGTIAVADDANSRILLLDRRFRPIGQFEAPNLLREATAISADGAGFLVADAIRGKLMRFEVGQLRPQVIDVVCRMPVGVAAHPDGSIWYTNGANHSLLRIPPGGGEAKTILGGGGTGERQLFRPRAVRIDDDGWVWVLDHGNHRGVVISPTGDLRHFGSAPYLPDGGARVRQLKKQQEKLQEQR
ncbi:MAG: hypothetical protein OSB09_02690 [Planctomycetota bacterium]|nr:hypothetical protein [Planctomycetota bacterium]